MAFLAKTAVIVAVCDAAVVVVDAVATLSLAAVRVDARRTQAADVTAQAAVRLVDGQIEPVVDGAIAVVVDRVTALGHGLKGLPANDCTGRAGERSRFASPRFGRFTPLARVGKRLVNATVAVVIDPAAQLDRNAFTQRETPATTIELRFAFVHRPAIAILTHGA